MKAFDAQTWSWLSLSLLVLTMFHTIEGAVLRQEKPRFEVILQNFLTVFQSMMQEASKNR